MAEPADLVVVGGGTIGGWASVFAREQGLGRVVVLERGLVGMGASSRAAGIVRAQGGTPATVALGRWTIDFYNGQRAAYGTDSGFRELGYLILAVTDDDERAGIFEFDGGLCRAEAEVRAKHETDALRRQLETPA